jgi:hypothetical protein
MNFVYHKTNLVPLNDQHSKLIPVTKLYFYKRKNMHSTATICSNQSNPRVHTQQITANCHGLPTPNTNYHGTNRHITYIVTYTYAINTKL